VCGNADLITSPDGASVVTVVTGTKAAMIIAVPTISRAR
jgi:hypothetical protein